MAGKHRYWAAAILLGALLLLSREAGAGEVGPVESVQKAWQDRQQRVKSARVSIESLLSYRKGSLSSVGPDLFAGQTVPPADVTHQIARVLVLDGEKIRYESADRNWSVKKQEFVTTPYT